MPWLGSCHITTCCQGTYHSLDQPMSASSAAPAEPGLQWSDGLELLCLGSFWVVLGLRVFSFSLEVCSISRFYGQHVHSFFVTGTGAFWWTSFSLFFGFFVDDMLREQIVSKMFDYCRPNVMRYSHVISRSSLVNLTGGRGLFSKPVGHVLSRNCEECSGSTLQRADMGKPWRLVCPPGAVAVADDPGNWEHIYYLYCQ